MGRVQLHVAAAVVDHRGEHSFRPRHREPGWVERRQRAAGGDELPVAPRVLQQGGLRRELEAVDDVLKADCRKVTPVERHVGGRDLLQGQDVGMHPGDSVYALLPALDTSSHVPRHKPHASSSLQGSPHVTPSSLSAYSSFRRMILKARWPLSQTGTPRTTLIVVGCRSGVERPQGPPRRKHAGDTAWLPFIRLAKDPGRGGRTSGGGSGAGRRYQTGLRVLDALVSTSAAPPT